MKSKLLFNTIIYIILFLGSAISIKQVDLALAKLAILLFFLGLSILISLKYFPFDIKPLFSIEYKNWVYILIAFSTPVICFISIISFSFYKGYLNHFSLDRINILGIIVSSIYVAITEELFFRGLIFYSLLKIKGNFFLAILISSLVFSIFHSLGVSLINDYPTHVIYILGSIILCYIMILSQSIIPCIVFHFTNNLLNKIVDFDFGIYEKDITPSSFIIFFPYFIPLILLCFYLIRKHNKLNLRN